jgi:hypothetical protein
MTALWAKRRGLVILVATLIAVAAIAVVWRIDSHLRLGKPVYADPPTASSGMHAVMTDHVCRTSGGGSIGPDGTGDSRLVHVDADPTGGQLVWYPGLNNKGSECRDVVRNLTTSQAVQLARAINRAPVTRDYGHGMHSCPMDDGSGVGVYLSYAGRTDDEVVEIALTGCSGVGAPSRVSRVLTPAVRRAIAPHPAGWGKLL